MDDHSEIKDEGLQNISFLDASTKETIWKEKQTNAYKVLDVQSIVVRECKRERERERETDRQTERKLSQNLFVQ